MPAISIRPKQLIICIAAATAAIICLLFVATAWVLQFSSASFDAAQTVDEAKLLHSLVDDYKQSLSGSIADYSSWTELYQYLNGVNRNAEWEKENLGPYFTQTFKIGEMMFISRGGRIAYSYTLPARSWAASRLRAGRPAILKAARLAFATETPGKQTPVSGFEVLGGIPCLVTAVTVRDSGSKAHSYFSLVAIRVLSVSALRTLGRNYGVTDLRPALNSNAGIALRTLGGNVSPIHLTWHPVNAGKAFFEKVLPALLVIGLIALLALLAVAFVAARILAHMQAAEQRTQRAELRARDARALAAEETARAKSEFIANMSHELRTPLNAIIGFSDMIRNEMFGPIGTKYREYVDAINDSGKHLLDIVNDILHLSRIDAGKQEIHLEPMALDQVVQECVRMTGGMAAERNVRVECQTREKSVMVMADRQALKQVLLNILSNAVKFSPAGAAIAVDCHDAGDAHVLRIRDHGCGIPEETLKEIGKPFVQAEGTYSRNYQGTGLGLAICFLLAEMMKGSIHIDSIEGVGTSVSLTLQRAVDVETPALGAERSAA